MQSITYKTRDQIVTVTLDDKGTPTAYRAEDSDNPGYRAYDVDFAEAIADHFEANLRPDDPCAAAFAQDARNTREQLTRKLAKVADLIRARLAGDTSVAATRKLHRALCAITNILDS